MKTSVPEELSTGSNGVAGPTSPRERVVEIIRDQPEDASLDDLLRELAFHRVIVRGSADAGAGRILTHAGFRQRVRRWTGDAGGESGGESGGGIYAGDSAAGSVPVRSRIRWTEESEASLESIHRAMSATRPATARRTLESLLYRLDSLAVSPESGRVYPYAEDVRTTAYGQFRVAYRGYDAGLLVLGVFHGRIFLPPF